MIKADTGAPSQKARSDFPALFKLAIKHGVECRTHYIISKHFSAGVTPSFRTSGATTCISHPVKSPSAQTLTILLKQACMMAH